MPDPHSPPLTPELNLTNKEIYRLVSRTFKETWKDYYKYKPPSTLPLLRGELEKGSLEVDREVIHRHQTLGDELKRMVVEEENGMDIDNKDETKFMGSKESKSKESKLNQSYLYIKPSNPNSNSNSKLKRGSLSSNTTIKLNLNQSSKSKEYLEGKFYITTTNNENQIKTIPPYFFCIMGNLNLYKEDEKLMPFIPIFNDLDEFNEELYARKFKGLAWVGVWRDPEVDIIQLETLSRIRKKTKNTITGEQIDLTRILPSTVAKIENLDLTRDLPPFPLADDSSSASMGLTNSFGGEGNNTTDRPLKRKWNQPFVVFQEPDQPSMDNFSELFCPRQGCTLNGCLRHGGFEDGVFLFHCNSLRQFPKNIGKSTPPKRVKLVKSSQNPLEPCTNDCYRHYTRSELLNKSENYKFPLRMDTDMGLFMEKITGNEDISGQNICFLSLTSNGYTCKETAIRILAYKRKHPISFAPTNLYGTEEEEDHAALALKVKMKNSVQTLTNRAGEGPVFHECDHSGPCSEANCECFDNNWPCGRNCLCPPDCIRRHTGCNCRKIVNTKGLTKSKRKGVCIKGKCPCKMSNRECDPELCGPCGADEDITSARNHLRSYGYHDHPALGVNQKPTDKVSNYCGNVGIQKGIWAKVRVGISPVAGYGIFAEQNIEKDCVIGEYIGEVISSEEGKKRDQINDQIKRHYLFNLNSDSEIDSGNYGNITRYINSAKGRAVNINAQTTVVNNEQRIIFRSNRVIKKDEEIRFDYGSEFDKNAVDKRKTENAEKWKKKEKSISTDTA